MDDEAFMKVAIDEAIQGMSEGGVPIGAALVADEGRVAEMVPRDSVEHGHASLASLPVLLEQPLQVGARDRLEDDEQDVAPESGQREAGLALPWTPIAEFDRATSGSVG